jgi:acyl-CoA synthetase (AMP-forming)/AMP-acid ligase II/thioesterase domain-containing protein/NADP-dependent 3-hydroxy acid dehydrogenase YdfG
MERASLQASVPIVDESERLEPDEAARIAARLGQDPAVLDCVVRRRRDASGSPWLLAYVVGTDTLDLERARTRIEPLPQGLDGARVALVRISCVPLRPDGAVDEVALDAVPVITPELIGACEARLRRLQGVRRAAVVVEAAAPAPARLHLADLLPTAAAPDPNPERPAAPTSPSTTAAAARESVVQGEALDWPAAGAPTLAVALERAARHEPARGVTCVHADGSESVLSYAQLLQQASRVASGLRRAGLRPQDPVILQCSRNDEFLSAFWGCQLGGFVPVPLSIPPTFERAGSQADKLRNCWELLDRPPIVASEALVAAMREGEALTCRAELRLLSLAALRDAAVDPTRHESRPQETALVLFTSGSTGTPKGVVLTHANLLSRSAATIRHNGFTSQDVSLNWFPLDHVGGLVMFHLRDVVAGCSQIQVATERILGDPLHWLEQVDRHRVSVTWAPNFAFALVNDRAAEVRGRRWDLSCLRFILNGGEAIVARTARRFLELLAPHGLPPTAMHPAWGMSETSSGVTFSARFTAERTSDSDPFVEVGQPIPGVALRVVDENDRPVAMGQVGRLQVRGSTVTAGYYRNEALNASAFTRDGWFVTGDLGCLDDGQLTITGREKDVIIVNGANFHCHEIEAVVDEVPGIAVSFSAACAVRRPDRDTDALAIFFCAAAPGSDPPLDLVDRVREAVAGSFGLTPEFLIPLPDAEIPKTSIGKIQREELRRRFHAGRYEAILERLDLGTASARTLPDWFFRRAWRRARFASGSGTAPAEPTLVLLDGLGVGAQVCDALEAAGTAVIRVEAGDKFARLGARRYRIDPAQREHYFRLLSLTTPAGERLPIPSERFPIRRFVHMWSCDEDREPGTLEQLDRRLDTSVVSLVHLVHALKGLELFSDATPIELVAVSRQAQAVRDSERVVCEAAPLLGLLRSLRREMPAVRVRHVDLGSDPPQGYAERIVAELRDPAPATEVALRGDERLLPRLERAVSPVRAPQPLPLRDGGAYLLSGGVSGIGGVIAEYLLRRHRARVLVVGRTPLVDAAPDSPKLQAYRRLEALGGELAYEALDVADADALERAVSRWTERWQRPLDGVFHLAGVLHERLLVDETRDSLLAALRPKVHGTRALAALLRRHPRALWVAFSSVNADFGGATLAAYAAANAYLEGFAHNRTLDGRGDSRCLHWTMWRGLGLARDYQAEELAQAQGYHTLSADEGLQSLLVGLTLPEPNLLIGLDGGHPHVRRQLDEPSRVAERLHGFYTRDDAIAGAAAPIRIELPDPFGVTAHCPCDPLDELPLAADGAIDLDRLARLEARARDAAIAPRTELERGLAEIWQEVLRVPRVGARDSFFALGGNSLRAIAVFREIERRFHKRLPLSTLFQGATVERLARALADERLPAERLRVVPIKEGARRPALLALHTIGGELFEFRPLAERLSPDAALYGIEPARLGATPSLFDSLEAMAERYAALLCESIPEEPYCLIGYSYGGLLAYEMARQLEARGKRVGLLAIVDTGPEWSARKRDWGLLRGLYDAGQLACHWAANEFLPARSHEKLAWLRSMARGTLRLARKPSPETAWRIFLDATFRYDRLPEDYQRLIDAQFRAYVRYAPRPYAGRITLYTAMAQPSGGDQGDDFGWARLASGGVDVVPVTGHHAYLMRARNVERLARDLDARLQALARSRPAGWRVS